jgi:ankyrin repeat protein
MWGRDSHKRQSLSDAVRAGDLRAVRKMLDQGADPNVCDPGDNNWPIHYAVNEGPEMVQLLVDHRADVNIPGRGNATALAKAEARGLSDVASVLRQSGASSRTLGDEFEMDPVFRLQIEPQIRQLTFQAKLKFRDQPSEILAAEIEKQMKYTFPSTMSAKDQAKVRSEIHVLVLRACNTH